MVTAELLFDLHDKFINKKSFDANRLVTTALFGSNTDLMKVYDPTKKYVKGDKCVYVLDSGEMVIIVATQETTGEFDARVWEEWNVTSELQNFYDDYDVLSWNEPSLRLNKVWIKIKNESLQTAQDLNVGNTTGVLIYRNLIISENRPTMNSETIWGQITSATEE